METTTKFIKRFYETPRAQEIYTSLRQRSKAVQRAINDEVCVEDIPDEITKLDKVRSLSTNEKVIDFPLDERNQEIEFDESLCNCDEPTVPETLLSECESKVSEIYNTILQDQKQRELLNWSLKVVNDREIIVEGQRSGDPSDISWKTSVICERISTNVVRSKKGTLYFLLGEINANDMIEKSFSEEIVSMFKYGFPPNWGDIFSKIVSDQPERENIVKVYNERKTPKMTKDITEDITEDITNRVSSEKTNAVHSMDDEMAWETDRLRSRTYSNRNTRGNDLSKAKTTTSSASNRIQNRKKKGKHSLKNTSESNDADEIEVQRSRSGRLICPVLDYWRGQRIVTSPCEGEITIIKSNLEEDSRLTLVETSRNSSGSLQNPTITSSAPTSGTNSSGTEWARDSPKDVSTSSNSTRSSKNRKSAQKVPLVSFGSLRAERPSDEATDTDGGERERTKRFNKKKFENEARTTSDEISESETSAVEQGISKSSSRAKSEKITKRSHPIKTRIRFNETKDTHENSVRETNFNERNDSRTYPTTRTTTGLIVNDTEENIVKHAKSTNSSKRQQRPSETQTQHSKKLKVDTGKLSSKTGTLARKRELRDMLEQQDEGYEDDAFEGTPFRSKKVSRKLQHRVSPVYMDNSVDVADCFHDKDCSRTPMNRLRPEGPLSTGKSEIGIMTPGLLDIVNRDDVDRYVNQLKRRKLRNMQRKTIESRTPLTKKPSNKSMTGGVDYSFNIQRSTAMDNEEHEDYYWSDNE